MDRMEASITLHRIRVEVLEEEFYYPANRVMHQLTHRQMSHRQAIHQVVPHNKNSKVL
jgi:hypothetical protein